MEFNEEGNLDYLKSLIEEETEKETPDFKKIRKYYHRILLFGTNNF